MSLPGVHVSSGASSYNLLLGCCMTVVKSTRDQMSSVSSYFLYRATLLSTVMTREHLSVGHPLW